MHFCGGVEESQRQVGRMLDVSAVAFEELDHALDTLPAYVGQVMERVVDLLVREVEQDALAQRELGGGQRLDAERVEDACQQHDAADDDVGPATVEAAYRQPVLGGAGV